MFNLSNRFYAPFESTGGGDEKEEPVKTEHSPESVAFHEKFSARRPGAILNQTITPEPPEEKTDEGEKNEEKEPEVKKPDLTQKRPGGNLPKILEDKRRAETERDEFRSKAERFEKEEKPTLEKKISELEAQIAEGGHTKSEKAALEAKLATAESKLIEQEQALVNENKELKSRLAFHDIQQDPDFQQQYIAPVAAKYEEAIEAIQGDEQKMRLLQRALVANGASLSANPAERLMHEKNRNEILSQIADSLDGFTRNQFEAAMSGYIRATKNHAAALSKHEDTRKEILTKRQAAMAEGRAKTFKVWTEHNGVVSQSYDSEIEADEEIKSVMKELKLAPENEVKELNDLVTRVITGRGDVEETVDLLQKGRVYPALKAKTQAQAHLIKGLKATIEKLRGTRASGEDKDGSEYQEKAETINHKFRASRPGGYAGR